MSPSKAPALVIGLLSLAGCAAAGDRTDYYRHSMSDLTEDWRRPGMLVFEASTSTLYPAESEPAEAIRMEWLAGWMKRSGYCPSGWDVVSRSAIPPNEVHVKRRDLRYEVRCAAHPAGAGR